MSKKLLRWSAIPTCSLLALGLLFSVSCGSESSPGPTAGAAGTSSGTAGTGQAGAATSGGSSGALGSSAGQGTAGGAAPIGGAAGSTTAGSAGAGAADSEAPTPPSGLTTADLTCNSVKLSWSGSTDNVAVQFYDIYHDGQMMKSVPGNELSTALVLTPGASWGLYVNARDAAGNVSQASTTLTLKVPQCELDAQAPTAPVGLAGTVAGTTVTLTWTAATDNVAVSAYDIFRNGVKVGSVTGSGATAPATTFMDSGLTASTKFEYYVVARDAQANVSAHSNTVMLTTAAACNTAVCGAKQITTDTDVPWGLLTLPDGMILYARRDAQDIIRLNPANGQKTTVGKVPNVQGTDGEGGLMGIELSPTFATDGWLYIMHTSPTDNRIVRMKYTGGVLDTASLQVLVSGLLRNKFHNGGRLRFGPDGKLYAATGDAQNGANAQDTKGLNGKVLRINPDGSVPADNPFGNLVWSYGHRNPQGLAFDSQGRLWEQEFGNSIMDETNLIQKGGNYGWPACEGTSGTCNTAGYIAPKRTYTTAAGSCSGIAVVRDVLYIACQRGTRMYRAEISGSTLSNVQEFFSGTYGRLRTVEPSPDGGLWLSTTNEGDKDSTPNNSNEKILQITLGQ